MTGVLGERGRCSGALRTPWRVTTQSTPKRRCTVTELFGTLEGVVVRAGTDAVGWARGRIAADQAHLNAGEVAVPTKQLGGAA